MAAGLLRFLKIPIFRTTAEFLQSLSWETTVALSWAVPDSDRRLNIDSPSARSIERLGSHDAQVASELAQHADRQIQVGAGQRVHHEK